MADHILDRVRYIADGQIDFEGQKLADNLATYLLGFIGVLSFVVGYALQDIKLAVYIALGGTALVFVLVVPAWPFFNNHPVKWLPVGGGSFAPTAPQNLVIDEKVLHR